ncbi:MAG: dUTP diphosphatase [Candidatus Melainabacteria bacterium]|nr:dUTP diphosphatase [Candidatus Melainabacteria bacterium]
MTPTLEKTQKVELAIHKMDERVETPFYASSGSAGFDLRAFIPEEQEINLKAGGRAKVPTGLKFVIPEGFEVQIRPRSGLAFKHGISLTNTPGTIDSDYRGEIQILMINHGDEDFLVKHGERIAQAVITPVWQADFVEIAEMPSEENNERGAGGFGSTGVK